MTYVIILALYVALLWLVAWASRRSMGVPTLTLAAGALLALHFDGQSDTDRCKIRQLSLSNCP